MHLESCTSIKDEDIEKLSSLHLSNNLIFMSVNNNFIENRGYALLLSYLESIPSFQNLSIANNPISENPAESSNIRVVSVEYATFWCVSVDLHRLTRLRS